MGHSADIYAALLAAVVLALIHVFARRLRFLIAVPRSPWLSAAAGISVAYVFAHLLPEIAAAQEAVEEGSPGLVPLAERQAYLVALAGLSFFYGVERMSVTSRRQRRGREREDRTGLLAFWLSVSSFSAYNAIIGYALVRDEAESLTSLALFTLAIGVHFMINDAGLREHHKRAYHDLGRWLLAGGVLVGWLAGALTEISDETLALLVAFISGGIILNVLKEELPDDREASFVPFLLGAAAYAALLQVV